MRRNDKEFQIDFWFGLGLGYNSDSININFSNSNIQTWEMHMVIIGFIKINWKTLIKIK